ncbi:cytochrome P450 [Mytilinidion resinicola]|uniref:Cytochrome P450 n=1 Tax=Mytilinidion resinicola TaxID=574789 RepID=A0A6A6YBY8_9PEZI|nr:cytochrome P450 [Mytilinidion resinicola]KAF2806023.1 cytochrome P450 [Mytilinidion resinicola]
MYAFDVIGEITFSKRFGFLETGQDINDMMHHTANFMTYTGTIGQVPNLDWYFRIKNPILHVLRPTSNILSFTLKQIQEHEKSPEKNSRDLLSRFIEARQKYPDIVDDDLLHDYTNTNVAGGSDTTAIMLRTLVFNITTRKQVLDKVVAEISTVMKARPKDTDPDTPITWAEGLSMTYYQACLKEAMRYHPPTAQILPRVVPQGGVELCGVYLPAGTNVGCNAWTVHRDKQLYGEDADEFRPERWLEVSSEQAKKMEALLFTFGAGKRACVGKNIALLEMTKFVPEFFRRFEVRVVDAGRYRITSSWLAVQSGLDVYLTLRDPAALVAEV